eukprot:1036443-Lingulodinium_polyedra.AAC.1
MRPGLPSRPLSVVPLRRIVAAWLAKPPGRRRWWLPRNGIARAPLPRTQALCSGPQSSRTSSMHSPKN